MSPNSGYTTQRKLYIGCAGWSLSRASVPSVTEEGTQLQKYASIFRAVEINSSFYKPHRPTTYAPG